MSENTEQLIELLKEFPLSVFVLNNKREIVFINKHFSEITGYSIKDIKDYSLFIKTIFPDKKYRDLMEHEMEEIIDFNLMNESKKKIIFKIKCKNNIFKYIYFYPFLMKEGYLFILCDDVTNNIKREEELINSREQLKKLMETTSVGIFIYQNAKFVFVNTAASQITGYTKEELIGMNVVELVHPDYKDLIAQRAKDRESGMDITKHYEFKIIDKNNNEKWVDLYADRFYFNNAPAVLVSIIDITQKKKLESQFIQSQKMEAIGHLIGGISHDFNNMLTPIIISGEYILYNTEKNSDINIQAKYILESANRAKTVINKLLAFGKQSTLKLEVININTVIREFLDLIKATIRENIEIVCNLEDNVKNIKADRTSLEQIIMNLVLNTQDAMPNGGKVIVETEMIKLDKYYNQIGEEIGVGNYLLFSVSDTGIGIDKDLQQKIFEPFFTTKQNGKGMGLGLSTVYGIVKQHNGTIHVYSEKGYGTTFKIYFPIVECEEKEKEKRDYNFSNKNVLIIDDQMDIINVLIALLKKYKCNTFHTIDYKKAIDYVKHNSIDLIITDIVMPNINGIELIKHIREIKPNIKTLLMSGYSSEVISQKNIQFEAYVSKPFSSEQLLRKLYDIFN